MTGPMWLAMLFALDVAGSIDVSDGARIYAHEALDGEGVAIDAENVPQLGLTLEWPATMLALEYAPRFYWSDIGGPEASPTLLLHTGAVSLSTRRERLTASIAQSVMVGDQSFARISFERGPPDVAPPDPGSMPTPPPGVELIPGPTVVEVVGAETSASLRYDWSRRVSTELRPSLGVSGGADATARIALPRQRTAQIDLALDYRASAQDTLNTTASVTDVSVSTGYDHRVVSLMETWSHAFSVASGASLGGGVAVQETTFADESSLDWQPVGLASAWHAWLARSARVRVQGTVGYRPEVNTLIGTLQQRFYASADATVESGNTTARLTLGAAQTFPLERIDTTQAATIDLVLTQALLDWLRAELGGQIGWQSLGEEGLLATSDTYWLVFAGARAELPTIRF